MEQHDTSTYGPREGNIETVEAIGRRNTGILDLDRI
jgi:hypothetical protein